MAKPEKNPIKIMLIVTIILLVLIMCVMLFAKQTQKDGKIGYFFKKEDDENAPQKALVQRITGGAQPLPNQRTTS